jgi:hypothetical protein
LAGENRGIGFPHRGIYAVGADADAADEGEIAAAGLVEGRERGGVGDLRVLVVQEYSVASVSIMLLLLSRGRRRRRCRGFHGYDYDQDGKHRKTLGGCG